MRALHFKPAWRRLPALPLALGLCLSLASSVAHGAESRSQSLLYNLAFEDQTDVFYFPHLMSQYHGAYFYLPAAARDAYGGIILGNADHTLGVFVHRPFISPFDQYRINTLDVAAVALPLVSVLGGNPGAAAMPHIAGHIIDLMYSAGGKWGVGARLHVWSDISTQQGLLADPAEANTAVTVQLNGSYQFSPGNDLSGNFGLRSLADLGTLIHFGAGFRSIAAPGPTWRPVYAAELAVGIFAPENGDASFGLSLPLKGGVRYQVLPNLHFALLGGIDLQLVKVGGGDTKFGLAIPTVELAAEWLAHRYLELRSAVRSGYGFQLAGEDNNQTPKREQLVFSSGVGTGYGPFRVEAVLEYALWQSGPNFISGATPGLFTGVTLSFAWDRQPSIDGAQPPVAAPAAPVKPVHEPAPRAAPVSAAPIAAPPVAATPEPAPPASAAAASSSTVP